MKRKTVKIKTSRPRFWNAISRTLLILALAATTIALTLGNARASRAKSLTETPPAPEALSQEQKAKDDQRAKDEPLLRTYLRGLEEPARLFPGASSSQRGRLLDELEAFYDERGYEPAWISGRELSSAGRELFETLATAERHGLDPALYGGSRLAERSQSLLAKEHPRPVELIDLDLGLSAAFLLYADHLSSGRLDPEALDGPWHLEPKETDLAAQLSRALTAGVSETLEKLAPSHPQYRGLVEQHQRYLELASTGGWPQLSDGPTIELGEPADAERLKVLVSRLEAEGDLAPRVAAKLRKRWQRFEDRAQRRAERAQDKGREAKPGKRTPAYDRTLAEAVERFQKRHGLAVDGKVGPNTLAAINVPVADRVRQIELNLERWRWLASRQFPERYLVVNIPEYRLRAYENGRRALEMNVVVGRETWQTPVFGDEMTYLEINPYWNVPASIAEEEILPAVRQDPGYLARKNMQVLAGWEGGVLDPATVDWSTASPGEIRFRQLPGPSNALGRIKFIFPNRFDVYLHDTPAQSAFNRHERALSHGCVRVERPLDLADFVLAKRSGWDAERVREVMDGREPTRVNLEEPLPVYLLYWTAFEDGDGVAHFRDDLYGYDGALEKALVAWRSETRAAERLAVERQADQRARNPRVST